MRCPQVISDVELAKLRTAYPLLDIKPLDIQMEQVALFLARGMTIHGTANATGKSVYLIKQALDNDTNLQIALEYLRSAGERELQITRDMLNVMLLEAHRKSATATEEINAVRELGKLNDLYPNAKTQLDVVLSEVKNVNQLDKMSDDQLASLAGVISLQPEEFEVVPDGED